MKINIDGLTINYKCEGEGKNILLLHGWGGNIDSFLPVYNHLKNRFRVYAIDFPGFGESQQPNEVWGVYDYARLTKKFIDKMNMEEVILIGHSFGGRVSIVLANKYPELIRKMILVDSAGLIPRRTLKYYIKVYTFKTLKFLYKLLFFWKDKEETMERFYKKFGSKDYQQAGDMRKILVKVVNEDLKPLLRGIKASTLLIWGENDEATPVYMGKIMEKEIEDSGLVVLKNAGHFSYLDQYNRFIVIVDKFLEESGVNE
ncbi:alpha/beta hydrolase [Caloranaerobacter sp. TR13]|uniref:alpha/beta fold hydrolase n=1 Tax=Caloranaerobacter sp. TR13 TaxID=1302151 RepID=UPI0006D41041|nr:alpha/beta hydrolase [Caloranaerobacter sp. TR13]KPU26475.1 alpha/beta hydrolase [Caloranaerobacter sp. TR13]